MQRSFLTPGLVFLLQPPGQPPLHCKWQEPGGAAWITCQDWRTCPQLLECWWKGFFRCPPSPLKAPKAASPSGVNTLVPRQNSSKGPFQPRAPMGARGSWGRQGSATSPSIQPASLPDTLYEIRLCGLVSGNKDSLRAGPVCPSLISAVLSPKAWNSAVQ